MHTEYDRRQMRRARVDLEQSSGEFRLRTPTLDLPIVGSNHISISGMDIKTARPVRPGTPVELHFRTLDLHLKVRGRITWCAERVERRDGERSALYTMGVEFDPDTLDDNSLLFLALRRFVDPFARREAPH